MKVTSLCGSLRPTSSTERALGLALRAAQDAGAQVRALNLRELDLPLCDGREDPSTYGGDAQEFLRAIAESDALIVGSPEYHGSLTGALKNALDLLRQDELKGKMVGLIATAKGEAGAMNTLNHLRHILRWMDAWVLPHQVSIPKAEAAFSADGAVTRAGLEADLQALGAEVVRYAALLQGGQAS